MRRVCSAPGLTEIKHQTWSPKQWLAQTQGCIDMADDMFNHEKIIRVVDKKQNRRVMGFGFISPPAEDHVSFVHGKEKKVKVCSKKPTKQKKMTTSKQHGNARTTVRLVPHNSQRKIHSICRAQIFVHPCTTTIPRTTINRGGRRSPT